MSHFCCVFFAYVKLAENVTNIANVFLRTQIDDY